MDKIDIIVFILVVLALVYFVLKSKSANDNPKCLSWVKAHAEKKGTDIIYSKSTNTYHHLSKSDGSCNLDDLVAAEPNDAPDELDYELFGTVGEVNQKHPKAKLCKHCGKK